MTLHHSPRFSRSIIAASLMALAGPGFAASDIVISQVYGGGGNSGATYTHDFIELFNRGAAPISLAGWSVQYASSSGSSWTNKTDLPSVTLQPGQFMLIQQAKGTGGTTALPTPDATGSITLSATNGKVALVASTVVLTGTNPTGYVDLVGFGSANHFEGAAAPTLSNTTAAVRTNACTDSDNNAADFSAATPTPRNTASPLNVCGTVVNQPIVASCPAVTITQGSSGSVTLSATDADSRVNAVNPTGSLPSGITLGTLVAAAAEGGTASVDLNLAASVAAGSYAIGVEFANDEAQTASCTVNVTVSGVTPIYDIQGSGTTSPLAGQLVTTQGVVTKLNNNGFFMQDETGDGNEATSDGIFVYTGSVPTVVAGDRVQVTATVVEYAVGTGAGAVANPLTELGSTPVVTTLSSGAIPAPKTIVFPEAAEGDLERYEGMLVHIEGPLTIGQNYFLGRYGQLTVSSGERLEKPTNRYPAGSAEAIAMADDNARRRLLLDDGTSVQNPAVIPYLGADNTVRAGDTIDSLTGVIDYGLATSDSAGLSDYRIHPAVAPVITRSNARTAAPQAVGGNVRIASFNVLNYFTTIDQSGASCYPSGTRSDCRGADSAAEFTRQKDKIVSAIVALNADVVGLMEIENNGNTAVLDLVAGLNAVAGAGTYASVALPAAGTGTDAIRVAMIYKPAVVTAVGSAQSDANAIHNRPPLAQTFAAANGEKFSVVVNHFKSKSSCPTDGSANVDQGDGQGCWNALRVEQAQALRSYIGALQASTGDNDVIVIGDLNAYGKEDPIRDFTDSGYVDQIARFNDVGYSYVFDGETGYLDHALATPGLSTQIAGAQHWRINADEPSVIDYNVEYKNHPECSTSTCTSPDYYMANAYRSSDHDPVVIGLSLLKSINGTAGRDAITGTAGDDVITGGIGADILTGGGGNDQFVFNSLRDGVDTVTDFQPGSDTIVLSALLASLGITSTDPLSAGYVTCKASGSDALLGIDTDAAGPQASRNLVLLKNQGCASLMTPANLLF